MPVAIGFHPYFQVNDAPRDEWTFGIAARSEWLLDPDKVPTGEKRPIEQLLPKPQGGTLEAAGNLDHVFGDLVRDASGRATMWVQGQVGADRRRVRAELQGGGGVRAGQPEQVHLLRADGRDHERDEHGASRRVFRAAVGPARADAGRRASGCAPAGSRLCYR